MRLTVAREFVVHTARIAFSLTGAETHESTYLWQTRTIPSYTGDSSLHYRPTGLHPSLAGQCLLARWDMSTVRPR